MTNQLQVHSLVEPLVKTLILLNDRFLEPRATLKANQDELYDLPIRNTVQTQSHPFLALQK